MLPLLTENGIPPRVVGRLTEPQRRAVVSYASTDKHEAYTNLREAIAPPVQPFADVVLGVAGGLTRWGATIGSHHKIGLLSSDLRVGETNFMSDLNLHSDSRNALTDLTDTRLLVLRLLCVASIASTFINLTACPNIGAVLDRYRINNGRVYKTAMLSWARREGKVLEPRPWDIVVFDATTPHNPMGAMVPHRRILQNAWLEIYLPPNWQPRIEGGDVPVFEPIKPTSMGNGNASGAAAMDRQHSIA